MGGERQAGAPLCAEVGLWVPVGTGTGSGFHGRAGRSPFFRSNRALAAGGQPGPAAHLAWQPQARGVRSLG